MKGSKLFEGFIHGQGTEKTLIEEGVLGRICCTDFLIMEQDLKRIGYIVNTLAFPNVSGYDVNYRRL